MLIIVREENCVIGDLLGSLCLRGLLYTGSGVALFFSLFEEIINYKVVDYSFDCAML